MGVSVNTEINLSEVITGLGIIVSVMWYASGLERRVALMEQQLTLAQAQQREVDSRQDRTVQDASVQLRGDLSEIKLAVNKLVDRELERGGKR